MPRIDATGGRRAPSILVIAGIYLAATIAMTWPLAAGLARDVPGDLGDALLNMWILDWMARGVPRVLTGAMTLADLANASIFHPEPCALGFSEHLFGETLLAAPVYAATGNLILSYNLLFLSTFVLAGLGMYVLARDLTGRRDAAFVAGLLFAFTPLRVTQLAHIQMLGTGWMPLALAGYRRYVLHSGWRALAGGTASMLMLAWSCGYYLLYFTPFVPLFVVHQMYAAGKLRPPRLWLALSTSALIVAVGVAPFAALYISTRNAHGFARTLTELTGLSADLGGYLTASTMIRSWGSVLRMRPASGTAEGDVFPGLLMLMLAALATGALAWNARREARTVQPSTGWRRAAAIAAALVASVQAAGLALAVGTGGMVMSIAGLSIRATRAARIAGSLLIALAVLLAVSPRARRAAGTFVRSWTAVAAAGAALSVWLSLGPTPTSMGHPIDGLGLYRWLFEHAPGFDGLRVPARYAMVASCFLSMLAASGAALLLAGRARSLVLTGVLSAIALAEGFAAPMLVNATWGDGPVVPPARIHSARNAPPIVGALASLPPGRVVAEFPFGDPAWELRYMYDATIHHQRLLNGYSGGYPRGYLVRSAAFQRLTELPDRAWRLLVDAGATHVVLHRDATTTQDANATHEWLVGHGARLVGTYGTADLYALP